MSYYNLRKLLSTEDISDGSVQQILNETPDSESANLLRVLRALFEKKTANRVSELICMELGDRNFEPAFECIVGFLDKLALNEDISTYLFALSKFRRCKSDLLPKLMEWTIKYSPPNDMAFLMTYSSLKDILSEFIADVEPEVLYQAAERLQEAILSLEAQLRGGDSSVDLESIENRIDFISRIGMVLTGEE